MICLGGSMHKYDLRWIVDQAGTYWNVKYLPHQDLFEITNGFSFVGNMKFEYKRVEVLEFVKNKNSFWAQAYHNYLSKVVGFENAEK